MELDFLKYQRPVRTRGKLNRSNRLLKKLKEDIGDLHAFAKDVGFQSAVSKSTLASYFTIFPVNSITSEELVGDDEEEQRKSNLILHSSGKET